MIEGWENNGKREWGHYHWEKGIRKRRTAIFCRGRLVITLGME
jgi:hypothetical protein